MKQINFRKAVGLAALIVLFPTLALAYGGERGGKGQNGPPPEAIEACENKNAGDNVNFTGRRGESMEATCQEIEGQLAAVPEGRHRGKGRRR